MRIIIAGIIAGIILLTACEKRANVELPYEGDKIVVNTMVQADSPVYVRVTQSQPATILNDLAFKELPQAHVTLLENGLPFASLSWQVIGGRGYFVSDIPAKPGKRYAVHVAATGLDPVYGSDTIPRQPDIRDLFARKTGNSVRLTLSDPGSEQNYYRVRIYRADSVNGELRPVEKLEFRVDPSLTNNFGDLMSDSYYEDVLLNDDRINGKALQLVLQTRFDVNFEYLIAEVCALTAGGYKYLRSVNNQEENGQDGSNVLGQTISVYSNITNGYGIVAGIHAKQISCKVE
ncbi:DUF4249 domain-containing protein [uncultured Chitinophaga sp.]|jgi:hypothetical protein|uniref:DUF4249 domain-containing protein n=1 Tax=uncultured Chitinophaga sp. TaxID=339340 RepID=UPI002615D221|nr:DUF4249 domain-containing protein [uncultured Chitinophaga sp.]